MEGGVLITCLTREVGGISEEVDLANRGWEGVCGFRGGHSHEDSYVTYPMMVSIARKRAVCQAEANSSLPK